MALIKIELLAPPVDGMDIKFKAPCDCSAITGMLVTYPEGSQEFTFRDSHGNNVAGIGNLFGEGAYVKVIVDVKRGHAYLQNADNNGFLNSAILGTYTHDGDSLTGCGENGKFKAAESGTISVIEVNGKTCSVKCGEESSMDLVAGCWYTFILDGDVVNFNAGGAGGGLNFKIVGNPQPASPKENTIWVNTDTAITGWQFSSDDPNLLDFNTWANNVDIWYGTKAVSGNSITLTANENDCHTSWQGESGIVQIPCVAGRTYILEWEHSGAYGSVYLFPSGQTDNMVMTSADARKLELTPADGVTFFTFRVGVSAANTTATYSNIRITEKERAFAPGAVWIQTGTTSTVAMNVLKKNSIQVCPISAKQYVGGAWVDKDTQIYQGGAWVELWDGTLFDAGNQYTDITGGWWQNPNLGWTSSYAPNTGTVTISDSLNLNAPESTGAGVSTKKPVDLTKYKSLKVYLSNNTHEVGLVVHDNLTGGLHDSQLADVNMSGTGEKSLDVSAITGSHYISLMNYNGGKADIEKVRLEG